MITSNKPARKYYLSSLVLHYSTLKPDVDFVFYIMNNEDEVSYKPFLRRGESLKAYQEIVHERPLIKFEEYLKVVRRKTSTNTRMTASLLATLDIITANMSRKSIPIIKIANGRRVGYREAPLCDFTGAFQSEGEGTSILASQLQQLYRKEGPKFTVDKKALLKAMENVDDSPELLMLRKNIIKHPEVFR